MAVLISNSTGNFTTAATWSLVDATSYLNSETNTTNTTTAFVSSQTFTPGAITVDGVAIKIAARNAAPTGTFQVSLFNSTDATNVATVTVNVSDIPSASPTGWMFMKFGASATLIAAKAYVVRVLTSTNAQVTLYRNATAGNWSRALRTTTTQAPAAADETIVTGDFSSAGSNNSYTVTQNNTTSATSFGPVNICGKGTLQWGTSASTTYYLKLSGNINLYASGTYTCGTAGTPMPSTSSASVEFNCTANVQYGFEIRDGSTVTTYGNTVTPFALLAADAAAAATSLTTNVSTGWKSGDVIALASTTRTIGEAESKALTADAVTTTLTITALTNAHLGTAPIQADLINLTRNVKIFGTSTANQSYLNIGDATFSFNYTEFYQLGSATALKRGIDVGSSTNASQFTYCTMHDYIVASSFGINLLAGSDKWTVDHCGLYNVNNNIIDLLSTGTAWTMTNNIAIKNVAAASDIYHITALRGGSVFTNNTANAGVGSCITISDGAITMTTAIDTIKTYGSSALGIDLATAVGTLNPALVFSNITSFRNTTYGIRVDASYNLSFSTVTVFGNGTANIGNTNANSAGITFIGITSNAGSTLTAPIGFAFTADSTRFIIANSTFGSTTAHATGDVSVTATNYVDAVFRDCLFSSTNKIINTTNLLNPSELKVAMNQQTAGSHITYKNAGTIQADTTIFNLGSPSQKLTPNNASSKLESGSKIIPVPSGQSMTILVFVRKSVVGDGAAYNGNQPRLILKRNYASGVVSDTVLATSTVAGNGAFEKLTAVTQTSTDNAAFEFIVDCDGTAGFINIDDWRVY